MTAKEFLISLPEKVPASAIDGIETLFHFDISGEGGGPFTVEVADNKIEVCEGLNGTPKCVITASNKNFIGVLKGEINPMMAVLMGKIKISNQAEMIKYAKVFGLM